MKKRPLSIVIISLIYFLEPAGNLVQAAFVNDLPLFGKSGILSHLLWTDWIVLCLFPVVGFGVYMVRKWGWYMFISFSCILIAYNLFAYSLNPNYAPETVVLFVAIITFISAFLVRRHVYAPYFNPRLRWWESAARYRVNLETRILSEKGALTCKTLDISETGCFVCTELSLEQGATVMVEILCKGVQFDCLGRVVRKSGDKETVPGYGLMFRGLPKESRKMLKTLVLSLAELGREQRKDLIHDSEIPMNFWKRRFTGFPIWALRVKSTLRHAVHQV